MVLQRILSRLYRAKNDKESLQRGLHFLLNNGAVELFDFNLLAFKEQILFFVNSMKIDSLENRYRFANSTKSYNLYSSVYAVLIYGLFREIDDDYKKNTLWAEYFNEFQSEKDGLWYDATLNNNLYSTIDWWGARHLAVHIIGAYHVLGIKPKYQFKFIEKYYKGDYVRLWLNEQDWNAGFKHSNDIDNKIMNIGCLLFYQRDFFNDVRASEGISVLLDYLDSKINSKTGMWGNYNINNPHELSRMIQFAYHILILYFYENRPIDQIEKLIDLILKTQNVLGGFGATLNTSACEDMDSIYLLINLSRLTDYKKLEIGLVLKKAFIWVLSNKNNDGGFVFQREVALQYGHDEMSAGINESSLFPTWFRSLSLIYLLEYFNQLETDIAEPLINFPSY